jgi:hypothetical protein
MTTFEQWQSAAVKCNKARARYHASERALKIQRDQIITNNAKLSEEKRKEPKDYFSYRLLRRATSRFARIYGLDSDLTIKAWESWKNGH